MLCVTVLEVTVKDQVAATSSCASFVIGEFMGFLLLKHFFCFGGG